MKKNEGNAHNKNVRNVTCQLNFGDFSILLCTVPTLCNFSTRNLLKNIIYSCICFAFIVAIFYSLPVRARRIPLIYVYYIFFRPPSFSIYTSPKVQVIFLPLSGLLMPRSLSRGRQQAAGDDLKFYGLIKSLHSPALCTFYAPK